MSEKTPAITRNKDQLFSELTVGSNVRANVYQDTMKSITSRYSKSIDLTDNASVQKTVLSKIQLLQPRIASLRKAL